MTIYAHDAVNAFKAQISANRQNVASLIEQDISNGTRKRAHQEEVSKMKSRWQKSLEAAVAAYDTPMPWARGEMRNAMIARRQAKASEAIQPRRVEARRA